MPYTLTIGEDTNITLQNKDDAIWWFMTRYAEQMEQTITLTYPDGSWMETVSFD